MNYALLDLALDVLIGGGLAVLVVFIVVGPAILSASASSAIASKVED